MRNLDPTSIHSVDPTFTKQIVSLSFEWDVPTRLGVAFSEVHS